VLRRRSFLQGRPLRGGSIKDITWFDANGAELSDEAWLSDLRVFGMLLHGDAIEECDDRGRRITGSTLTVIFNAAKDQQPVRIPPAPPGLQWRLVIDTADDAAPEAEVVDGYRLAGQSVVVLRLTEIDGAPLEGGVHVR
jgi:glycogen operon protein